MMVLQSLLLGGVNIVEREIKFKMESLMRLIIVLHVLLILSNGLLAVNSPFLTYTISGKNEWKITQDAYVVSEVLFKDLDLYYPDDIFIWENKMYIADSGNARIVVFDMITREATYVGDMSLFQPTGVFVDDDYIYVADPGTSEIVIFDKSGNEVKRIGRPTNPLFGETANFKPKKLVVDKRGNFYIVSEGTFEGIIQLDQNGEFLGYFGANTVGITFLDKFIDIFYTKEQKEKFLNRIPKPYTNITIDSKGLIYTVTQKERGNAIKKHNTIGLNILPASKERRMIDEPNFIDIAVDNNGRMFALTETGLIYEYDSEGNLLVSFGGRAIATERNGLFTVASAITVDADGKVYVLDRERGLVHVFNPTQYIQTLHKALELYSQGKYLESKGLWKELMIYDGYSKIAHYGLGKAYFQEGNYRAAADEFKKAYAKRDYSDAYWEIRNEFLQKNAGIILLGFILFIALLVALDELSKRGLIKKRLKISSKFLNDIIYIKNILRHPLDTFYYIQRRKHGSVLSATIIYVIFFLVIQFDYFGRSFIFNLNVHDRSVGFVLLASAAPTMLWVFANYLVSSINDGRGTLRDIYIFTAYSFAPYILFQPFVILLTYILTYNEAFIVSFVSMILITWSAVLLFTGVKEIHDYGVLDTIKSILLTLVWIFVIILVYSIVYMLWDQLAQTIYAIVQEVLYRARK
ncbi:Periplasmic TolA-binding protein (function unknown) [Fervidobacterium changbaicum]|nr:Periplasmic TolA-binding protein (function unknown) [Fervidobacterium changbaicum]